MKGRQKRAAHAAIARRMGGTNRADVTTAPNDGTPGTSPAKRPESTPVPLGDLKSNTPSRARFVPKRDR